MDRADASFPVLRRYEPSRKPKSVWTSLAAAAILGAVLLLWPRPESRLRAETLLPRIAASVARDPYRARHGLRVRTPTATFVRPAGLGVADRSDREWRERFRAANYNWDDPVSPRAFSEWRDGVKHKTDRVLVLPASSSAPKQITIQTTAKESLLQYASLTVDASSLLPVRARFVFGDEDWVEISVMPGFLPDAEIAGSPGEAQPKSANVNEARTLVPPAPAIDRNLASSELAVWLVADRLDDPMGEPVRLDIRKGSRISVTPFSLNAGQLQKLTADLQGIPGVNLRVPEAFQAVPEAPPDRDPAINLSETIFSRAHLMADLAEHFPAATEMTLSLPDQLELWQLRSRHARQIEREIESLQAQFQRIGLDSANDGMTEVPSSSLIQRLVQEAGAVNRSVTTTSAGRRQSSESAETLRKVALEIARLKVLADEYAHSVAQRLEKLQ